MVESSSDSQASTTPVDSAPIRQEPQEVAAADHNSDSGSS